VDASSRPRQALVPALHFRDFEFAGDDDTRGKTRRFDPLLQLVGKPVGSATTAPAMTAIATLACSERDRTTGFVSVFGR
jgi:hypothetical protein